MSRPNRGAKKRRAQKQRVARERTPSGESVRQYREKRQSYRTSTANVGPVRWDGAP